MFTCSCTETLILKIKYFLARSLCVSLKKNNFLTLPCVEKLKIKASYLYTMCGDLENSIFLELAVNVSKVKARLARAFIHFPSLIICICWKTHSFLFELTPDTKISFMGSSTRVQRADRGRALARRKKKTLEY